MGINETEIRKAISVLKEPGQLFEVRLIDASWNMSGYFTDADTLLEQLKRVRLRRNANIYITLGAIRQECYSRQQRDRLIEYAKPTTSDGDVEGMEWLMIDIDPRRPAGTSSSDEQIEASKKKANEIYLFLKRRGFSRPVSAMSGNGIHLLYRVALGNTQQNVKIMQNALAALNLLFSDDDVEIDLKTYNPARVCKLYGTIAQKGADTPERPHRMSGIVDAGSKEVNKKALLEALSEFLPREEEPQRYNHYNPRTFDLQEWIDAHGIKVSKKAGWNGGTKWILEECPFDGSHTGRDASIIQTADGKICFNCFHNSCAGHHWRELRLKFEPDAYDKKYIQGKTYPNYKNQDYQVERKTEARVIDGQPVFYTTEQIRLLKAPPEEFIRSGIEVIDSKMRGLKKGYVTCLSGLRACGKSSIISQFTVEAVNQGYRVALFSGELTPKNTLKWLSLQCAGKNNVSPTQYENYYKLKNGLEETISKWLDEKVYVYNNKYGNDFQDLQERLRKCVVDHKVDLVILDNLMALNISMLDRDIFRQQSLFVEQLEDFAKANNVHVLFVAHPRKSDGFLRLQDVSGSNDIVNRTDNAFILHRVNEDFKRLSKQMFRWSESNTLYQCDNVLEIAKDRDGGIQDEFIPLYFERESKRLKNSVSEYKTYGWEASHEISGFHAAPFEDLPF